MGVSSGQWAVAVLAGGGAGPPAFRGTPPPGAPPQAGLDQPRPVARGHRRVERVAVAGERDAPEVAVARGERLAVDRDREVLLQVAELLRVDHVDDRRGGGELADVGVRVA